MAADTECLCVGELHRRIETTPKNDTHRKTAQGQETQAEVFARRGDRVPVTFEEFNHYYFSTDFLMASSSSISTNSFAIKGWTSD